MRYAQIRPMDISNGEGIGVALFVQGCPIHCEGCFQPETWDFTGGEKFTFEEYDKIIELMASNYISRFSILGGEPLYHNNLIDLMLLCKEIKIKYPLKDIWLWSGYTWKQIQERIDKAQEQNPAGNGDYYLRGLLSLVDYAVVGPFVEEEKDLTLQWRGSRNQEVIDMKQTLATGKKVIYV